MLSISSFRNGEQALYHHNFPMPLPPIRSISPVSVCLLLRRGEGTTTPRKVFDLYYTVRERVYISILDCAAANRMERMRAFVCVVLSSQARTHTTVRGWNTRNSLYVYIPKLHPLLCIQCGGTQHVCAYACHYANVCVYLPCVDESECSCVVDTTIHTHSHTNYMYLINRRICV